MNAVMVGEENQFPDPECPMLRTCDERRMTCLFSSLFTSLLSYIPT
jgi:hypothetical protein